MERREKILAMMRCLKHMPDEVLDNPEARLIAYESAGALTGVSNADYAKLDKEAVAVEKFRKEVYAEITSRVGSPAA
jgi:hypothetical protein